LLFAKKINSEQTKVNSIVNVCFNRGIFNKKMWDNYKILTSSGIQKRYSKICTDAKRKDWEVEKQYNLLKEEETTDNTEETIVNPEETPINSEFSTQSKVKKSKVNNKHIGVFDYWNSKAPHKHKELTTTISDQLDSLSGSKANLVLQAIDNYCIAYYDNSFYYSHVWTLDKFIKQKNGYVEWLQEGKMWVDYSSRKKTQPKQEEYTGFNDYYEED